MLLAHLLASLEFRTRKIDPGMFSSIGSYSMQAIGFHYFERLKRMDPEERRKRIFRTSLIVVCIIAGNLPYHHTRGPEMRGVIQISVTIRSCCSRKS